MPDADVLAQAADAISDAAGLHGAELLSRMQSAAADGTVHLGTRVLDLVLRRDRRGRVRRAVQEVVGASAGQQQRQSARQELAEALGEVLQRSPELAGQLQALFAVSVEASGSRSVAVGVNPGVVATGDGATITQINRSTVLSAHGLRPVGQVPAVSGPVGFPGAGLCVGRKDESADLEAALRGGGPVVVQAVSGLGGIGKTTLAAHYVERHAGEYQQVVWITADSAANLSAGLARFAVALEPELSGALPDEALAERALGWLAAHDGWLVVLDNVNDPAQVKPLIARAPRGRVLVTSRRATGWTGIARTLPLGLLDPDDALSLIAQTLGASGARLLAGAEALCERLGYLPLALGQAAAFLAERRVSTAHYLRLLDAHPAVMLRESTEGAPAGRTIAQVWAVTLDALADDPLPGRVLRTLAWLAPDGIDPALLDGLGEETAVLRAFGRLRAYSMLTDEDSGVSLHRLVQEVARTPDEHDPHRAAALISQGRQDAASALCAHLPGDPTTPAHWPAWRTLTPHVQAYAAHTTPDDDTPSVSYLLNRTATYLHCQGSYGLAIAYLQRCVQHDERAEERDEPTLLASRNNLANAYREAGQLAEAVRLYEANLADRERILGPDHRDTMVSRNNLAYAYRVAGRLAEAIPLHEATLADRERVLGPDHPDTLTSRNNLAFAYRSAGWMAEAVQLYEATLADRERILGPDHPDTLTSRNNLAYAYRVTGRLGEAVHLYEATLADRERVLGPDNPNTLISRNNLAYAYRATGRLAEAVRLYEATLADRERILGPDHPRTVNSRRNLQWARGKMAN